MVEIDVGDDGDAAVPGMGRVEPATQPDLDEREVEPGLGEVAEDHRGQELELGRVAVAPRDPVRDGEDALDEPGEVVGARSGRPSMTIRSRYVTRWGFGVSPTRRPAARKRAAGQREDAALAVRAGDERPADGQLRVAELAEQGPGPPEARAGSRTARGPRARRRAS